MCRGTERYTVKGQPIELPVRRRVCVFCGETVGTDKQDAAVVKRVGSIFEQIKSGLKDSIDYSQRATAGHQACEDAL